MLRGIRALLYSDGLTIKGVQKILKDRGHRHVAEIGRGARFTASAPLPPMPRAVTAQPVFTLRPVETVDMFSEKPFLAESDRVQLEMLLAELLCLKARLKTVRS